MGIRFLLLCMTMLWGGGAYGHQSLYGDSGISGPPYATISADLDRLARAYPDWATVVQYGESLAGKPLKVIKIQSPDAAGPGRVSVSISGAIHGNEYINIADRLPEWFIENRETSPGVRDFFAAGGTIYIVPIVNPDGYDRDRRHNNAGADLNRDFDLIPAGENNFDQPETREWADYLDAELTMTASHLKIAVDYHCCDGSLLFPWSYTRTSLPADDLEEHRKVARWMQQMISSSYEYGSTGQVLGYYPRGTTKDYYFAKYDTVAFTFEGAYARENRNFSKHTVWWDTILAGLADDWR